MKQSLAIVAITGIVFGLFLSNFFNQNPTLFGILGLLFFFGIWYVYGTYILEGKKAKIRKDAYTFLPFLLLGLYPLQNIVAIPEKFQTFSYLPSALLFMYAVSFFVVLKLWFTKKIKKKVSLKTVYITTGIAFILISTLAILKHLSFFSTGYDLGIYVQVMEGYTKGRLFESIMQIPLIGFHVQPILFIILPIFMLFPSPITLLIIQSAAIAASIIPLFFLAKTHLKDSFAAYLASLAFILYPSIGFAALFDFHPIKLAIPFVLFSIHFFEKSDFKKGLLFLFIASLCKEQLNLLFVTFGLYVIFRHRKYLMASLMILAGIFLFYLSFYVISPQFHTGTNIFFETNTYFGETLGEALKTFVTRPIYSLQFLLDVEKLAFLVLLLAPFAFLLPLVAPHIVILAATEMGLLLFYSRISIQQLVYHHPVISVAILFAAFVLGGSWILKKWKIKNGAVILGALLLSLCFLAQVSYGPFAILYDLNEFNPNTEHVKNGKEVLSLVPDEASVAANNWILPHLSNREFAYTMQHILWLDREEFVSGKQKFPEYIVLDLSDAFFDPKRSGNRINEEHLSLLFNDKQYGIVHSKDTWLILQKESSYEEGICHLKPFIEESKFTINLADSSLLSAC